jgi:hypothetical protein
VCCVTLLDLSVASVCQDACSVYTHACWCVLLFCSLGSYITGTTLDVEGGEEVLSASSKRQEDGRM